MGNRPLRKKIIMKAQPIRAPEDGLVVHDLGAKIAGFIALSSFIMDAISSPPTVSSLRDRRYTSMKAGKDVVAVCKIEPVWSERVADIVCIHTHAMSKSPAETPHPRQMSPPPSPRASCFLGAGQRRPRAPSSTSRSPSRATAATSNRPSATSLTTTASRSS